MRTWWRPLLFFFACIFLFAGLRVLRAQQDEVPVPSQEDLQTIHGVAVEVSAVQRRRVNRALRLYGTVRGAEQAEVVSATPNILQRLHVAVGQQVRVGQLLASMRSVSLSPLGYPYQPLKVQHEALQAELERMAPLLEQGAVTRQQYDQLKAQADAAAAQYDSALASVRISAPIAGTVTRIDFRPGQMVPNDRPLMQVARIDPVVLDLMAEAGDLARIELGAEVTVRSSALPDDLFLGRVAERSLGAYPVLNQFPVRVEVPNPRQRLLPGFPVEAEILLGSTEPVLAVPRQALAEHQGRTVVWLVGEGGLARAQAVEPGVSDDSWQAVVGELQAGDQVVTLGQAFLRHDGQRLIVVEGG